jgi:hypothetical protein
VAPFVMPYKNLYDAVQSLNGKISTKWLKEKAISFSDIINVKEQWSGILDSTVVRGFYIEGPIGPPIPLKQKESLITLARSMCVGPLGDHWRRFIYTKELMHVFDNEDEKANSPEKFDIQIEKFSDPAVAMSPQFRAEQKAFWRALGVLCPVKKRDEFKIALDKKDVSYEVVAACLRIPVGFIRELMRDDFPSIIQGQVS